MRPFSSLAGEPISYAILGSIISFRNPKELMLPTNVIVAPMSRQCNNEVPGTHVSVIVEEILA
jgi:hypothetical protein